MQLHSYFKILIVKKTKKMNSFTQSRKLQDGTNLQVDDDDDDGSENVHVSNGYK